MEKTLDRKGMTGGSIKIMAMLLMVLDHLRYFLIQADVNVPIWFNWLGRIVAPLFIYMTVEGYAHTSNKKKYLLRLYIASVIMSIGNSIIPDIFPMEPVIPIVNSMFGTLFLLVLHLVFIDTIREGFRNKKFGKVFIGLILLILPSLINLGLMSIMMGPNPNISLLRAVMTFVPLPLMVEGGLNFIFLGIILYLLREKKKLQILAYILYCVPFILATKFDIQTMLFGQYQWMMIFAAPFMILYNGEKGKGFKYLFYIFYPVHVYIIYIITWILKTKIN